MKRLLLPIFLKIAKSLGIDEIQQRLDETSSHLAMVIPRVDEAHLLATDAFTVAQFSEQRASTYTNEQISGLNSSLNKIQSNLAFHIDQKQIQITQEIQKLYAKVDERFQKVEKSLSETRNNVDAVRRSQSSQGNQLQPQGGTRPLPKTEIDEVLYVALEDRFRGDRDQVAERQRTYLEHLGDKIDANHPLLDLGCGRGEWLKVLKHQGLSVIGVDGNSVCVTECQEGGLNVVHDDILSFLQKSDNASFGAVTLFQVFEHLPFGVLVEALREIHRVLTPSGVLIAEIPNSKNLRVGSGTFWIDPTHERPLFPDVLMFLAEQVGFEKVDGKYVNRLGPQHDLSGLPDGATQALTSIVEALDGPGDFALIAKR